MFGINHTLAALVETRDPFSYCLSLAAALCLYPVSPIEITAFWGQTLECGPVFILATSPLYSERFLGRPKTKLVIYKIKEWYRRRSDVACLPCFPRTTHSFLLLSLPFFFFPPSLKPRMQCLFKNALTAEIFHCLACWRRGRQERAIRHTKYFAFHANSSLLTNGNPCFLARFPHSKYLE